LRPDKTCYACGQPVDLTVKRNKMGNRKVQIDGIWFPSVRQGKRYLELKTLQAAGEIFKLELEVWFDLDFNGVLVCRYRADFVYQVLETNGGAFAASRKIVEDAKGFRTKEFIIKKKLMRARFGIEVQEV
jgi:hypothetical protein